MQVNLGQELTLPNDIMYAVVTGRHELILDREFNPEEQRQLLQLIRVLLSKTMDQAMALEDFQARLQDVKESLECAANCLIDGKEFLNKGISLLPLEESE